MEQLNNLDVVFLIVIGISALVGIARGMTKEILSICGWVLATVALFYLTPVVNPITKNYIASDILSNVVTGMVIVIVFCIIWILIVDKVAAAIRQSKISTLDRLFGFVFGAARGGLIIVLLALMVSTLLPESSKTGVFGESKIYQQALLYVEPLKAVIPSSWIEGLKEKTESLGFGKTETKDETKEKEQITSETQEKQETQAKQEKQEKNELVAPSEAKKAPQADSKNNQGKDLDANLEVLKKTGEELFNQLAQPKPAGEAEENGVSESDLDKLLDVLEDNVIAVKDEAVSGISQNVSDKVVERIKETVADQVSGNSTK